MKTIVRRFFHQTILVTGMLISVALANAQSTVVYDLKTDWSYANNPNGVWTYAGGYTPLAYNPQTQHAPVPQPAWQSQYLPLWVQWSSGWLDAYGGSYEEAYAGDIATHSDDSFGAGDQAQIIWTSPFDGVITISGGVWHVFPSGAHQARGNSWTLLHNGFPVTGGEVGAHAPYSKANPMTYDMGTGGVVAVQHIPVSTGDTIVLEIRKLIWSPYGTYTGVEMTVTATPDCAVTPAGITGWWRGDGNALDSYGTDHGQPENLLDFVPGKVGQAFNFTGDERIRFDSTFALHQAGDASVEFWVNYHPTSHQSLFWTRPDETDANRFNISLNGDSTLYVDYRAPNGTLHLVNFHAPLPGDTWAHVAIVRQGNEYTIFVNGVAAASTIDASPDLPTTVGWQISGRGGFFVTAQFDELTTYNRALSPTEVQEIYEADVGGKCSAACVMPSIIAAPQGQATCPGQNVTLTVVAAGTAPLSYQWSKDGSDIPGATSQSLTITAAAQEDAGDYQVRVSNVCGTAESAPATLSISDLPPQIALNGATTLQLQACVESYSEAGAVATDDCDGTLPVVISGDPVSDQPGTYVITYTATDSAGHVSTITRTIIIADTQPPVFTSVPANLTVSCSSDGSHLASINAWIESVLATDQCGTVTITHSLDWSGTCNLGSAVATWVTQDGAGNTATASAVITLLPDENLEGITFVESVQSVLLPLNAQQQVFLRVTNSGMCPTLVTGAVVLVDFSTPLVAIDPLFPIPFTICPGEVLEIPVNVDTTGALAGSYTAAVELRSQNEATRVSGALTVDVNASLKPDLSFNAAGTGLQVSYSPLSIVLMPGEPVVLSATVKNVGSAAASAFTIDFLEGSNLLGSQPVPDLAVGATVTVQLDLPNGFAAEGFYIIRAQANSPANGEISLANNVASAVLQVGFLDISGAAIVIEASATLDCNGLGYISGRAYYEILSGDHVLTFPVQGGFGTLTIEQTGAENSGWHTLTDGSFNLRIGNSTSNVLNARIEITDFSIERAITLNIPALTPCIVPGGAPGQPGTPPPDLPPGETIDLSICSGDLRLYRADHMTAITGPVNAGELVWIDADIHYYNSLGNSLANQIVEFVAILPDPAGPQEYLIGTALVGFSGGGTATASQSWSPPVDGEFVIRVRLVSNVFQNANNDIATRALIVGNPPPGLNSIIVSAGGSGCGSPVVSVSGNAVYGSQVHGVPAGVPVICGDVLATLFSSSGEQLASALGRTDKNGEFATGIRYTLSPGDYVVRVEVSDGTLTGIHEFSIHCDPPGPAPNTPPGVSGDFYVFAEDVAFLGPDCLSGLFRVPVPGETISIGSVIHYFGNTPVTDQRIVATVLVPNGDQFDAVPIGEQFVSFSESGTAFTCFNWTPLVLGPQIIQIKIEPSVPFAEFDGNNAATRVISIGEHQCRVSITPSQATVQGGQSALFSIDGETFSQLASTLELSVIAGSGNEIPSGMSFSFNPPTLPLPGRSALTVSVTANTPPGTYPLLVVGRNSQCTDIAPFEVTVVQNEPPVVTVTTPTVVVGEGSPAMNNGIWSDPDGDSATFAASIGIIANDNTAWQWSHLPAHENESGPVTISANDGNGGITSVAFDLVVSNVPPAVVINNPESGFLLPVNTPVNFEGTFFDPGVFDSHAGYWVLSSAEVPETIVPATIIGDSVLDSLHFTTPGVYSIKLVIIDNDGGVGEATTVNSDLPAFVVVFDPNGGHVTGGGWIWSPAGAYYPDNPESAAIDGRATFGFVAKYQQGAQVPTGNTEFQFRAGNLNFHSSEYEWLVVAGARAQYKGYGTINHMGPFRFMLTVVDGDLKDAEQADRLRMKIWDPLTDMVIYDNHAGASDGAELPSSTTLRGGNIVIHKN